MKEPEIVVAGKDNGEDMVVRYQTSKGTEVYGLAIPNIHADAEWDLGPTWCYLVLGQKTILIDTGRFGNFDIFRSQLKAIGKSLSDIDVIIISHGHEDHDGNLPEVLPEADAQLWAHQIYRQMILYHPDINDGAPHPEYPGSCRSCMMPESFVQKNCAPYHNKRSSLKVSFTVGSNEVSPIDNLSFIFTPGHSPDSICIILDDEVIFTGDTVLPDITPHPSQVVSFESNRLILPENNRHENQIYGLMNYVKSLAKIASLDDNRFSATLPAHRLFYGGQFNLIHSTRDRAREIIQFHIDRCRDIMKIISSKPKNLEQIAEEHFTPTQLAGFGSLMARHELLAHFEVMEQCGDIRWSGENNDLVQHTGSYKYLDAIGKYLQ